MRRAAVARTRREGSSRTLMVKVRKHLGGEEDSYKEGGDCLEEELSRNDNV